MNSHARQTGQASFEFSKLLWPTAILLIIALISAVWVVFTPPGGKQPITSALAAGEDDGQYITDSDDAAPDTGGRRLGLIEGMKPYNVYYGRTEGVPCDGTVEFGVMPGFVAFEIPSGAHLTMVFETEEQARNFDPSMMVWGNTSCYYKPFVECTKMQTEARHGISHTPIQGGEVAIEKLKVSGNKVTVSIPAVKGWGMITTPFQGGLRGPKSYMIYSK